MHKVFCSYSYEYTPKSDASINNLSIGDMLYSVPYMHKGELNYETYNVTWLEKKWIGSRVTIQDDLGRQARLGESEFMRRGLHKTLLSAYNSKIAWIKANIEFLVKEEEELDLYLDDFKKLQPLA